MQSLLVSISGLIGSIALLGAVLFLHRIATPIGHALMNLSLNLAGKRLARFIELSEKGREILIGPESDDGQD